MTGGRGGLEAFVGVLEFLERGIFNRLLPGVSGVWLVRRVKMVLQTPSPD